MSTEARLKSGAENNSKRFLKVWAASGKNLRGVKRKEVFTTNKIK